VAGRGLYQVGPSQEFTSLGAAVSKLVEEQGHGAFTEAQTIRVVESGIYEPVQVPPGSLNPIAQKRLVFDTASGVDAIISGRAAPERSHYGFSLSNIPYVKIDGFEIQDVRKGIVMNSCFQAQVYQNRIQRCLNAGIWINNSQQTMVLNNALVDNWIGLSFTRSINAAAFFNTIYQRQGRTVGCFFDVTSEHIDFYSNIVHTVGHPCVQIYRKNLDRLRSNYNVLWAPGSDIGQIIEKIGDSDVLYERLQDYERWYSTFQQDYASVSTDPQFVNPQPTRTAPAIDVRLRKLSVALSAGLHLDAANVQPWPSWSEDAKSVADTDIDGVTRPLITEKRTQIADRVAIIDLINPVTVAGAYATAVDESTFMGDPVFVGDRPPATTNLTSTRPGVIERAADSYAKHVECWHPRIGKGFFWVRDRQYYLYASKSTCTLGDIQETLFDLPIKLLPNSVTVTVRGQSAPLTSWDLHGNTLVIKHKDLGVESLNDEAQVTGDYYEWQEASHKFITKSITVRFKFRDGENRWVLPEAPKDAAPIVVTDDTIGRMDRRTMLHQQYRVQGSTTPGEPAVLEFLHHNKLLNPDFHYGSDTGAGDWEIGGSPIVQRLSYYTDEDDQKIYPLRGGKLCHLAAAAVPTGNYIGQQVRVDYREPHVFSVYAKAPESDPASLHLTVVEYDALNREITGGTYEASVPTGDWQRFGLNLWRTPSTQTNLGDADLDFFFSANALELNTGTASVLLKLSSDSDGVLVDAAQLEEGYRPTRFTNLPRGSDGTVEYETSDAQMYQVNDLPVTPIRNPNHAGFLYIGAVPAQQLDTGAPADATTLSDWAWPRGRTNYLPWAKLHGANKMRRVSEWDQYDSPQLPREISPGLPVPNAGDISMDPGEVVARQGNSGEGFALGILDGYGNPFAFERARLELYCDNGAFPGYLHIREWGLSTKLGQDVTKITNEKGEVAARWIPPASEDVEFRGTAPSVQGTVNTGENQPLPFSFVDVRYPVNATNHGNASVHQDDDTQILLTGVSSAVRIMPRNQQGKSVYELTGQYPNYGSVTVQLESITGGLGYPLIETRNPIVAGGEFYVDYERGQIMVEGTTQAPARVVFTPRTTWRNPVYPRRIYFDARYLDTLTGDLVVRYDAFARLKVTAQEPTGVTQGATAERVFSTLVAQNPNRGDF